MLLLAGFLASAAPAHAAVPWSTCVTSTTPLTLKQGYNCATVSVPIDRANSVPGTIALSVTRKPASGVAQAKTAVVALAGGPGQAALPFVDSFAETFKSTLFDKDLLVFDQRGTGTSSPLGCVAFRAENAQLNTMVASCANEIGPRRGFYRTADTVEDIEALRIAGGYDKLILFGVSYGTKVALAYAAAHPAATEALILDSTVALDGPDALMRPTLATLPRALGQALCADTACADASPDVNAEVRQLASMLDGHTAYAPVYTDLGQRVRATVGVYGFLKVIEAGDLNPQIRADLPGAVHAALRNDFVPLLRLSSRSFGLRNNERLTPSTDRRFESAAETGDGSLYAATMCEETYSLPWDRAASPANRAAQATAYVKAQPASSWGIFPVSVALMATPTLCLAWPNASPLPAKAAALPDVRTLILSGQYDVRTPLEDAQRTAALLPRSQLVAVPYTGHSVVTGEFGTCAQTALTTFLAGGVAPPCTDTEDAFPVSQTPPRTLSAVDAIPGLPRKVGRTLAGVGLTIDDLRRQVAGSAISMGALPDGLGGLRGGSLRLRGRKRAVLKNYQFIGGLKLSGTYVSGGSSRLRVSGSASNGTVTVTSDGQATGRLGTTRIRRRPTAFSARTHVKPMTFANALRHVRIR
jgi:pimeloyl-ACP methyl ester carboxylesterase